MNKAMVSPICIFLKGCCKRACSLPTHRNISRSFGKASQSPHAIGGPWRDATSGGKQDFITRTGQSLQRNVSFPLTSTLFHYQTANLLVLSLRFSPGRPVSQRDATSKIPSTIEMDLDLADVRYVRRIMLLKMIRSILLKLT
jgi:hypothetical protein